MKSFMPVVALLVVLAAIVPAAQAQYLAYTATLAGTARQQGTGSNPANPSIPTTGFCYLTYNNGNWYWGINIGPVNSQFPLFEVHLHNGNTQSPDFGTSRPGVATPPLVAVLSSIQPSFQGTFQVPNPFTGPSVTSLQKFSPVVRNNAPSGPALTAALAQAPQNQSPPAAAGYVNVYCDVHSAMNTNGQFTQGPSAIAGQLKRTG